MDSTSRTKEPRGEASGTVHYEVRDASSQAMRELRQAIRGSHWSYAARKLEILEWICGTDRQFEHARRVLIDLINGEEKALMAILSRWEQAADAATR